MKPNPLIPPIIARHNYLDPENPGPKSTVYCGDAVKLMKHFPDKYFKLAIVDPPYFSGPEKREYYGQKESTIGVKRVNYPITQTWEIPGKDYFKELFRVSENQIVWGCNYYDFTFGPGRIIWDKVNQGTSYSDCELAYCSLHDSVRIFRYMWNGMCQGKNIKEGGTMQGNKRLNEKRIHPTQKPVALYRWLLHKYANEGDNILDTHLGSGSHRIAAYEMGFDFTAMELSPEHFKNQNDRFLKEREQRTIIFN